MQTGCLQYGDNPNSQRKSSTGALTNQDELLLPSGVPLHLNYLRLEGLQLWWKFMLPRIIRGSPPVFQLISVPRNTVVLSVHLSWRDSPPKPQLHMPLHFFSATCWENVAGRGQSTRQGKLPGKSTVWAEPLFKPTEIFATREFRNIFPIVVKTLICLQLEKTAKGGQKEHTNCQCDGTRGTPSQCSYKVLS